MAAHVESLFQKPGPPDGREAIAASWYLTDKNTLACRAVYLSFSETKGQLQKQGPPWTTSRSGFQTLHSCLIDERPGQCRSDVACHGHRKQGALCRYLLYQLLLLKAVHFWFNQQVAWLFRSFSATWISCQKNWLNQILKIWYNMSPAGPWTCSKV